MEQSTAGAIPAVNSGRCRQSPGGAIPDQFFKNVILLKNGDFQRIGDQARMPTASEISTIKARAELGQFKRKVEFFASMSEDMVKRKLEQTFPYLNNKRFSCAAVIKLDKDSSRFEFHGYPRLWDGKTIKRNIKGNSALYILEDEISVSGESEMETDESQQASGDRNHATSLDFGEENEEGLASNCFLVAETPRDGSPTMQTGDSNVHQHQSQVKLY